jgi:hypothetical protein
MQTFQEGYHQHLAHNHRFQNRNSDRCMQYAIHPYQFPMLLTAEPSELDKLSALETAWDAAESSASVARIVGRRTNVPRGAGLP